MFQGIYRAIGKHVDIVSRATGAHCKYPCTPTTTTTSLRVLPSPGMLGNEEENLVRHDDELFLPSSSALAKTLDISSLWRTTTSRVTEAFDKDFQDMLCIDRDVDEEETDSN